MSLELTILRPLLSLVLGSAAKKAWGAVLGSEYARTFERLVWRALRTAVESDEYLASLPSEDQLHVQSVLRQALAELDENTLIRLNNESDDSVVAILTAAAQSGRFDLSTLGTDPFFLISRFLAALREGVQTEAKQHGSPLFEFTTQEHLIAVREALFALVDRFDRAGDAGDVFVCRYVRLRDLYLPPWDTPAGHDPHRFVGREWLTTQIDEFINREQCGYFVLEADAGLGKTAFLANLVRTRRYLHHFVQPGQASRVDAALKSLAAQLIQLIRETGGETHLPADRDVSELFQKVLIDAAGRLPPEQQLVLVVDGLDEAETPPGLNPLGLPSLLPPGVFFVVSHQPRVRWVNVGVRRRRCHLRANDNRNLLDMQHFLHQAANRPGVAAALAAAGYSSDQFVLTLANKCKGVWIYLHYVVEEIERGDRSPLDLDSLPYDVWQYYARFWNRWSEQYPDDWYGEHLPLLATLGAVQEPATLQLLCALADIPSHPRLRRLLGELWRPFVAIPPGKEPRYSVYHSSLREFLAGQLRTADWEQLTEIEASRLRELANETQRVHRQIVDRYLTAWGRLVDDLPVLAAEPSLAQRDDGYPLRELARHLVATGRDEDLHKLLACDGRDGNVWYAAHESAGEPQGFLNDVALARLALDRSAGTRPSSCRSPDVVSRKIRYALVEASVATVFTDITPALLGILVKHKCWSPARALGAVERMTDEDQQVRALLEITHLIRDEMVPAALVPDIWSIALTVQGKHRNRAIAALISWLPDDLLDAAVQAVAEGAREPGVLAAAAALVDKLPDERLNDFPWFAMPTMYYETKMIVTLLVDLKLGHPGAIDSALEYLVEEIDNEFIRCQYLATLIPRLPVTAFDATMAVLEVCPARYRSDALLALARHAPTDRLIDVLDLAHDTAWENTPPEAEPHPWRRMMQEIGQRLAELDQEVRANLEAGALAVAHALRVDRSAEAIELLAPHLTTGSAFQVLQDIEADSFRWKHPDNAKKSLMIAIGALAKRLSGDRENRAKARAVVECYVRGCCHVDNELRVVLQPGDDELSFEEAELLAPVAASLPRDTVRLTVRSICRGISLAADFATELTPSLSRLAPTVATDPILVQEVLDLVLRVSAEWRSASRLTVLSALAPHLTNKDDDLLDEAITLVLPGPIEAECFAAIAALGRELPDEHQRTKVARRALDMARRTANDTHRTRAITELAPTLPDDLAKHALEFIGSVTHSVLHRRVLKAIDNLTPQLPETALRDALAIFIDTPMREIRDVPRLFERLSRDDPTAIRTLFQRWPQKDAHPGDSWVWALAPFLTESLAEKALDIARALPVDYARRLSMAALAPRLPYCLRRVVAHEVLELLDVPPDDVCIRLAVLARLAAATVTDEVTAACQRLLSRLQPTDVTYRSWDALDDFLTHLPTDLFEMVLGFSIRLLPNERFRVIRTLAPRLPVQLRHDLVEALESLTVGNGNDLRERARALIALATHVPDKDKGERHRVLDTVLGHMVQRRWWDVFEPVFVELIPQLPNPSRSQAVSTAVWQCFNRYSLGDLGPLLSVLEGPELNLVFTEVDRVRDPHKRATATAAVLRRAGALAGRSMAFRDLDVFGGLPPACTRAEMFAIVGASAWWIHQQGGDQAVLATIDALFDVSRWWR